MMSPVVLRRLVSRSSQILSNSSGIITSAWLMHLLRVGWRSVVDDAAHKGGAYGEGLFEKIACGE